MNLLVDPQCLGMRQYMVRRNEALKAVEKDGLSLERFPEFTIDRVVVLAAVRENGNARRLASKFLQNDRDVVQATVDTFKRYRELLPHPPLTTDVVKAASLAKRVYISHPIYASMIGGSISSFVKVTPLIDKASSDFIRDSHLVLLNGVHLLPHQIDDPIFHNRFLACLPEGAKQYLISDTQELIDFIPSGKGYDRPNTDQAVITMEDHRIPYKFAKTCVEGGNGFIFMDKGTPKAIIGWFSVLHSVIALEEQGYFDGKDLHNEGEPSLESYRIARNLDLYSYRRPFDLLSNQAKSPEEKEKIVKDFENVLGSEFAYRIKLISPFKEMEKETYRSKANEIEAKLRLTKALIAEELEVPLENIAFVPQYDFHIDMEMFVTPGGTVAVNDDEGVVQFLETLKNTQALFPKEKRLVEDCLVSAKFRAALFQAGRQSRIEMLKEKNFSICTIPAIFEAPEFQINLNYCNGIFLPQEAMATFTNTAGKTYKVFTGRKEGFNFVTTGPTYEEESVIHAKFSQLFRKTFPNIPLRPVQGLSSYLALRGGGLHCLTFEGQFLSE